MDRPSRNRKSVNYSDFQDDDDEDFASVKPPPKKARADPDSERNGKTACPSPNLTSSGNRKRVSLDDKCYERDLEAALTLSLLNTSKSQDGELRPQTDEGSADDQPLQCSPPVLVHCSADSVAIAQPGPSSPPVLSSCSVDGRSLGLDLISIDASPSEVSRQTKTTEKQRKSLKGNKSNKDDDDYQPQNTPDSESDADFTEGDESEDETFTVKKKKEKVVKQKATPVAKEKKEKKDKRPVKASKAKSSVPNPAICRSPAAPVSGLKKTPTTPPVSKPALCSSPAGGRLPKWNPPAMVGRSPGASDNAPLKSPGQGLRLGLSRRARVKPLHPNVAAN